MKLFRILTCLLAFSICESRIANAQIDMVDLHTVQIVNAPADIADWPITRGVSRLTMRPSADPLNGLAFEFTSPLPDSWKWYTGSGDDNFQYTVWACASTPQPTCSAFLQMWQGRINTGAPILTDFHANWAYSTRWGSLYNYAPKIGDTMAFFVSAGNARDQTKVTSVRERSNVVTVQLPAGDSGSFPFVAVQPPSPPVVPPVVPPATPPPPQPLPSTDLSPVLNQMSVNQTTTNLALAAIRADVAAMATELHELKVEVEENWTRYVKPILKWAVPAITAFVAGKKL